MRQKRIQDERNELEKSGATSGDNTGRSKPSNNEKYIEKLISNRNLNDYEKIEAVKRKASLLEEKARQQEKLILMDKQASAGAQVEVGNEDYSGSVERTMAVNDMYIDAIQAKLKLLDQL